MSSRTIQVSPFDLVVFGGTGDLAARKLLPALFQRDRAGQLPDAGRIIGVSRRALGDEGYLDFVRAALKDHVKADDLEPDALARFLARIHFQPVDVTGEAGWAELAALLANGADHVRAFYFAVAPDLFAPISQRIKQFGLVTHKSRVVVEKTARQGWQKRARRECRRGLRVRRESSLPHRSIIWARKPCRT